jgi:formylglycine-generating enzyme required for sulfatase activity
MKKISFAAMATLLMVLAFMALACPSKKAETPQAQNQPTETPQAQEPGNTPQASEPVEIEPEQPAEEEGYSVDLGDGVTMVLVPVPAGTFLMGSPDNESNRDTDEGPQANIAVDAFMMGKTEVTQAQYSAIVGSNPSQKIGDDLPVEYVSYFQATEFCNLLSLKTGKKFALPTEAQWEYACRAGSTTAYYWGDDTANKASDFAWCGEQPDSSTHPVGTKQPNAWGLYDISGNVWEWTLSLTQPYPYTEIDGRNAPEDTEHMRTIRGGSWNNECRLARSSSRQGYNPQVQWFALGFRVVCLDCAE